MAMLPTKQCHGRQKMPLFLSARLTIPCGKSERVQASTTHYPNQVEYDILYFWTFELSLRANL